MLDCNGNKVIEGSVITFSLEGNKVLYTVDSSINNHLFITYKNNKKYYLHDNMSQFISVVR